MCRAFTIAELVIVAVIIGLMAAISVPHFANAMANQRLESAVRRIVMDFAAAKSDARTNSAARTIVFDEGRSSYSITEMDSLDRPGQVYQVNLGEEPYKTTLSDVDFASAKQIVFDGYGKPDTGGTFIIASRGRRIRLTVDGETGKVTDSPAPAVVEVD